MFHDGAGDGDGDDDSTMYTNIRKYPTFNIKIIGSALLRTW